MKILTIVGARPQFIKASPVSCAQRAAEQDEVLLHTGQHYDYGMSQVFFDELGMAQPDINLGIGSGTHAEQTAGIESARRSRKNVCMKLLDRCWEQSCVTGIRMVAATPRRRLLAYCVRLEDGQGDV